MCRCFAVAVGVLLASATTEAGVSARILLGVGDTAETVEDGEIVARGAQIATVEPWRFDDSYSMLPGNRWKMSTHPVRVFSARDGRGPGGEQENGELVWASPMWITYTGR